MTVTLVVEAVRSATKCSTCSVTFEDCGLVHFDASKVLEKRCMRDVEDSHAGYGTR
jgi:hypothetical protein